MLYTGKEIVVRIRSHMKKRGGANTNWFVGVSKDARARLFVQHHVRKKGDSWILVHAKSSQVARKVKSYLVKKLGISGGADAESDADFVYAYRKRSHTKP